MNQLNKLSRQDIETKYLSKPILIISSDNGSDNIKKWYIVSDVNTIMPLHMLTSEESDLYDQDKSNIEGIEVVGVDGKGYLMWIYFDNNDQDDSWKAFGYEWIMKIQIIRKCQNCFFYYCRDLEDDICYEDGGCKGFSPVDLIRKYRSYYRRD